MEFFDKLGKKASEAYKVTADKTGKIAKETKIKFRIGELKNQINSIYEEIGKKVYEKHIREEELCIKKDLEEQCTKIDVLSDEIDSLLKECLLLKDKKQCQKCYKEIEKDAKFCPNCGEKQKEEPAKEAEILEDLENTEIEEDEPQENKIVIESLEQNAENEEKQDNAEEVEESKDDEKQLKESEEVEESSKNEEKTNLERTVEIESNVELEEDDDEK